MVFEIICLRHRAAHLFKTVYDEVAARLTAVLPCDKTLRKIGTESRGANACGSVG